MTKSEDMLAANQAAFDRCDQIRASSPHIAALADAMRERQPGWSDNDQVCPCMVADALADTGLVLEPRAAG